MHTDPKFVTEILLPDGWHQIDLGTFKVNMEGFYAEVPSGEGGHVLQGPRTSLLAWKS